MTAETATEPRLNPNQAAEILGVQTQTLANWRSKGTGPKYYKGRHGRYQIFYHQSDLEAFMAAEPVEPKK